jgi:tetrahydromethanopterin S-methyltransferase subunit E
VFAPQPLLLQRPFALQLVLAVLLPALFGAVCGLLLGVSEAAYLVASALGILGGLAAGHEHPDADEGVVRGFCGGLLFGTFILVVHSASDERAKAMLPHPHFVLPVLTTILGMILGAIGGALRGRHERRTAAG